MGQINVFSELDYSHETNVIIHAQEFIQSIFVSAEVNLENRVSDEDEEGFFNGILADFEELYTEINVFYFYWAAYFQEKYGIDDDNLKDDKKVGFLFMDKNGMPKVAGHWQKNFQNMINKYNRTHTVQLPEITPHVCRHTYCTNMARAGMNPKSLQYLMGHSEVATTMDVYMHFGYEEAKKEVGKMSRENL